MAAFPWGAALMAGGNILGGLLGDDGQDAANRANQLRLQQAMGFLRSASMRQRILFSRSEDILKARSRLVLSDIDRAENEARTGTKYAEQAVQDQATAAEGSIVQGAVGRGLGSSSVTSNLQRALASDTGRAIGAIREQQGARLTALALQRAQVRGGLMGDQASLQERRAGAEVDMNQRFVDLLSSVQDIYTPNNMAGNFGMLGGLLGNSIEGAGGLGGFLGGIFGGGRGGGGGFGLGDYVAPFTGGSVFA